MPRRETILALLGSHNRKSDSQCDDEQQFADCPSDSNCAKKQHGENERKKGYDHANHAT